MAIKPITNKQIVSNPNRGKQTSTRNTTNRSGNSRKSIIPGLDITKGYSVTLKDVDTKKHIRLSDCKSKSELEDEIILCADKIMKKLDIKINNKIKKINSQEKKVLEKMLMI